MQYDLVNIEDIPRITKNPLDSINLIEVFKICNCMEQVCLRNDGVGLSAVQVGLPWNIFIVQRGNSFEHYLNCSYERVDGPIVSLESCLSLKDELGSLKRFEVQRHSSVLVKGQRLNSEKDLVLEEVSIIETGFYAVVFQHEIDHCMGTLISDKGREIQIS